MSSKEAKMKMRYDLEGLRTEGMWTIMIHLYSIRGMVYGSSSEDVRIVTRQTRIRNCPLILDSFRVAHFKPLHVAHLYRYNHKDS